jgi:DNA-binding MarR family transcriptional regulator
MLMYNKEDYVIEEKLAFQFHKASNLLRRVHGAQIGESKQEKKDGKVTHSAKKRGSRSQATLLRLLILNDGLAQREIVDELDVQPSSASVLIDKLAEDGLVRREGDTADKRSVKVFITDAGKAHYEQTAADHAKNSEELFAGLSDAEQEQLSTLLDKLITSLKEQGSTQGVEVARHKG